MNILVIGGSKGTGALAVKVALGRGHYVTCFSRTPEKLDFDHPKLRRFQGDFHKKDSVLAAVKGHDAVMVTASSTTLSGFKKMPNFFSLGTGYVIEAMKANNIKRLVILSALGTGDSRKLFGFAMEKLLLSFLLKLPFEDHERQEKLVFESSRLGYCSTEPTDKWSWAPKIHYEIHD